MVQIKTIESEETLKKVFNFLSKLFYEEAIEYDEHYYNMTERYKEMKEQLKQNKKLLLYIEDDNKIIAALTSKNINIKESKITLGVMGVSKNHRRKSYAKMLIQEFEKRCRNQGLKKITLGARFRACQLYITMNYKPTLMVQVFDFATIEDVKKNNKFKLTKEYEMQSDGYGFIFFKVNEIKEEYIKHFEDSVKTAQAQYIFNKNF